MIQRLRKRFIRIAMLSVALVLLALTLIVNIANFVSTNRDINEMLDLIYEGPDPGTPAEKPQTGPETGRPMLPQEPPKGPFNQETPYSMRYFTLTLDADGTVADGDFTHIASVTQQSAIAYAGCRAASRQGLRLLFLQLQIPCDCAGERAVSCNFPRLLSAAARRADAGGLVKRFLCGLHRARVCAGGAAFTSRH